MTELRKTEGFNQVIQSLSRSLGNIAEPQEPDHDYDCVPDEPRNDDERNRPHSISDLTKKDSYIDETYMNVNRIQKSKLKFLCHSFAFTGTTNLQSPL